jgi:hypothetical protein
MSTPGNLLLYAVSGKREVSWPVFKRIFDTLARRELVTYENAAFARSMVLRAFDSLGHWEVLNERDGLRIAIAPSCLSRLPSRTSLAVLCGSRSAETIDLVRIAAAKCNVTLEITSHPGQLSAFLPDRVVLRAPADFHLEECARRLGITLAVPPPAYALVSVSTTLRQIAASLEWKQVPELNWSCADFDPEHNCFLRVKEARVSFRLTRYLDPQKNVFRYYMWDSEKCAEIDVDWGRYLALHKSGFNVLYFDATKHLFALPKSLPLPRLLARGVALCCGSSACPLTSSSEGGLTNFAVYELVPHSVAELTATKLGQELLSTTFNIQRSIG